MLTWAVMIRIGYLACDARQHDRPRARQRGAARPRPVSEPHAHVEQLARRIGLRRMPEVYLMQQDGAINAFATRFLRSQIVVLFADLLDACGDN